ncbi:hypothetical protein GMAR_ORF71 [Golden Marseillevirus]|uniref:hypothetical protein n=1 Tax=Golden Marseillevirus TaxID=1720526 RepID=UPI000877AA53|nr:hypothetical protein GMAR_ORF71 [Golden Marseillevirus]ALX27446.1 hypothetical protein GMAR_ORF71 [Golden Marseillevirus]
MLAFAFPSAFCFALKALRIGIRTAFFHAFTWTPLNTSRPLTKERGVSWTESNETVDASFSRRTKEESALFRDKRFASGRNSFAYSSKSDNKNFSSLNSTERPVTKEASLTVFWNLENRASLHPSSPNLSKSGRKDTEVQPFEPFSFCTRGSDRFVRLSKNLLFEQKFSLWVKTSHNKMFRKD